MTKQRGLETLRACPKARYEDGLDTAKNVGFFCFLAKKKQQTFSDLLFQC